MLKLIRTLTLALLAPVTIMAQGMPGLLGPDHFGLTVPNLPQALAFFTDVMGCKSYFSRGPFRFDGDWMKENLNVHPRTEIRQYTWVRCGHGTNIELFDYRPPEQNTVYPANSDIGGHHVGFLVDDINAAVTYLRSKEVRVLGEPKTSTSGPMAGRTWVYFLAPWGTQLELAQNPVAMPYENEYGPPALWSPAKPAEERVMQLDTEP